MSSTRTCPAAVATYSNISEPTTDLKKAKPWLHKDTLILSL
jgi:hypothetical protein